jgi:hypothetical protein
MPEKPFLVRYNGKEIIVYSKSVIQAKQDAIKMIVNNGEAVKHLSVQPIKTRKKKE